MTTPTEKRQLLDRLYTAWLATPELRLGQLIVNAVLPDSMAETARLYHIEDTRLVEVVERYGPGRVRGPR